MMGGLTGSGTLGSLTYSPDSNALGTITVTGGGYFYDQSAGYSQTYPYQTYPLSPPSIGSSIRTEIDLDADEIVAHITVPHLSDSLSVKFTARAPLRGRASSIDPSDVPYSHMFTGTKQGEVALKIVEWLNEHGWTVKEKVQENIKLRAMAERIE